MMLWFAFLSTLSFASTLEISLRKAVELSIQQNPKVKSAIEKLREAEANRALAVSALFPSLSLSLKPATIKDASTSPSALFNAEPYNYYTSALNLTQPITAGGGEWAALGATKKQIFIEELGVEIAKRDVGILAIQQYGKVLLKKETVQTLLRSQEIQRETEALATQKRKVGRTALLDLLQIRTSSALLEPKIEKARADLDVAINELVTTMSEHQSTSVDLTTSLADMASRLKALKIADLDQVPEVETIVLKRAKFEHERWVSFSKHLPTLSLVGSLGRSGFLTSDLTNPSATYWSIYLQVSIPLFSGLSSFQERSVLAAQAAQLEATEVEARQNAALAQIRSRRSLDSGLHQMEASLKALDLARASLKEAKSGYRDGRYDFLKFFNSEDGLVNAELAYMQAVYDTLLAVTDRVAASGNTLETVVGGLSTGGR